MDVATGFIQNFSEGKLEAEQRRRAQAGEAQLVRLQNQALKDCYKCRGTGHKERNGVTGLYKVCPCTLETDAQRAKHEAFLEMMRLSGPGGEENYGSAENY